MLSKRYATPRRGEAPGRNVAWRIDVDPSLEKVGKQFAQWHADGVLARGDRGLILSPDLAYAFAWFAPEEKAFLDTRLALYEKPAADYVEALKCLTPNVETGGNTARQLEPLANIMRRYHANHLVVYYTTLDRFPGMLMVLENDRTQQFKNVYRDGHAAVFAWANPEDKTPNRLIEARVSDDRDAFGRQAEPPITDRPRTPEARAWYERYLYPRQFSPLASDEAAMHLQYFSAVLPHYKQTGQANWLDAQAAGLVGSGVQAPTAGLAGLIGEPLFRAILTDTIFEATNKPLLGSRAGKKRPLPFPDLAVQALRRWEASVPGPMAQPLLAVRAARRALLENPDDATAWYRLQFAYATLNQSTREREWTYRLPMLSALRQAQRMVALDHAVKLEPDFENAHAALAEEYERLSYPPQGFLDLALHHRSEQLRVLEANGPGRNEELEEYEARRKWLVERKEILESAVNRGRDEYELGEVTKTNMRAKAEFALLKGLGGKARDDLLKSVEATVEREAIPLQLDLMIVTGQIEGEAGIRGALEDAAKESEESGRRPELGQLGQGQFVVPRFEWFQVLVAAASGDYRAADEAFEPIIAMREQMHANFLRLGTRFELLDVTPGTLPARGMLPASLVSTQVTPLTLYVSLQHARRLEALRLAAASKPQTADLYALRGLLALEAGDNAHAVKMFRKVLQLEDPGAGPVAKYYLDLLEANGQR